MIAKLVAASAALGVGALFLVPVLAVSSMSAESTLASSATPAACSSSPNVKVVSASLDTAQLLNASDIISAASTVRKAGVRGEIVAVAVGLDESDLTNDANNAVPASLRLPHEGLGADHDSLGVFQDRPSEGWGSVPHLMDVTFEATEFLTKLVALPGWGQLPAGLSQQQTDTLDGQAAQAIQRSGDSSGGNYVSFVPLATQIVSSQIPVGVTLDSCTTPTVAISAKVHLPAAVVAAIRRAPAEAQRVLAYALSKIGDAYVWGAVGPKTFDCSGLVMEAYLSAGFVIPRTTWDQVHAGTPVAESALRPADLLLPNPGHIQLVLGRDAAGRLWIVEAPHTGAFVQAVPSWGFWQGRRIIPA